MTTAQVVETSVTVNNNIPIQDYVNPDDQTQPTFEMTPGCKPFAIKTIIYNTKMLEKMILVNVSSRSQFLKTRHARSVHVSGLQTQMPHIYFSILILGNYLVSKLWEPIYSGWTAFPSWLGLTWR